MADIELVIKIPEEVYKASQIIDVKYEYVIQIPLEVIANGTPLPKHHRRLLILDEERVNANLTSIVGDWSFQKWINEAQLFNSVVTIIPATKGEEDGSCN